jgi:hypothetical protein
VYNLNKVGLKNFERLVEEHGILMVKIRFDEEFIAYLLELKWWDWEIEKIEANFEALSSNDLSLIKDIKI